MAHALDLIGERWALLVMRELMLGPKRFTDLRKGLPSISPNVLTQRLQELEDASVLRRRKLPPPASVWVYELTSWGAAFEPVMQAMGRWGASSPGMVVGFPMSVSSLILSLRTMFNAKQAAGFAASIDLRLSGEQFQAAIGANGIRVEHGEAGHPDARIEGDQNALAAVIYGGRKLSEAIRSGDLTVTGDKAVVKRFVTLFPFPERAATN